MVVEDFSGAVHSLAASSGNDKGGMNVASGSHRLGRPMQDLVRHKALPDDTKRSRLRTPSDLRLGGKRGVP